MGATESSMQGEPEPGDLIEIFRQYYTHWALYVGGGNVIHLTVPDGTLGVSHSSVRMGLVKKEPLARVVGEDSYRVRKYDTKYNHRPRRTIIRGAEAMVGEWVDFDSFANNCELFTTRMRPDVQRSPRTSRAENGLTATTAVGAGLGLLAVAGVALAVLETQKTQQRK